jgi:hypothetical protein
MSVEPTPADIEAVKVLIAHQRRDIGSCVCGWGVDTGDVGRSHSLHVWRELQRVVLPEHDAHMRAQAGEDIARALIGEEDEPHGMISVAEAVDIAREVTRTRDAATCPHCGWQMSDADAGTCPACGTPTGEKTP